MIAFNQKKICLGNEHGVVLVTSVAIIAVISVLTLALINGSIVEAQSAERAQARLVAFHWAEGAIDQTIAALRANRIYACAPQTAANDGRISGAFQSVVTPSTGNPNVYKISATGSVGGANTLVTAQQRVVTAVVDLTPTAPFKNALFSNSNLLIAGRAQTNSYDSSKGAYNIWTATARGHIGTNATGSNSIVLGGNARVNGDAIVGPNANVTKAISESGNASITGSKTTASSTTILSPVTIPSGTKNLGPLSLAGSTVKSLSAGTYYYSSLSISGASQVTATGPVTIYVAGNVTFAGSSIVSSQNLPPNLTIYFIGSQSVTLAGSNNFYGVLYAPQSSVTIAGRAQNYGALVGKSITAAGSAYIHFDEALKGTSGSGSNQLKSWQEVFN